MKPDTRDNNPYSSMLKAYNQVIEHYDFVIQDLSSEIYDPDLERAKQPVIDFLKTVQAQWVKCRDDVKKQIDKL